MIEGFPPIAEPDARVLILGTMPSVASLKSRQYYGHPQNKFWPIIFSLWGEQAPDDYSKRVGFLKEKHIALWDVICTCEREGSADSEIKNPVPNDFKAIKEKCPNLVAVFFNSKNAEIYYKRLVKPDVFENLKKFTLPSTSPARAMSFEKKRQMWLPVRVIAEQGGLL
ncbi:MAG TPA: DNA-deoxyinosine glycosylase [Clostridiales bacterium]|nr:DNA-deoxyinosine glycosylase [Clostridiales bacterium]